MHRILRALLALALAACALGAHAGRSCEKRALDVGALDRGLQLAERTRQALDRSGARVAVLGRAGQDLSRWRLHWSHVGLAYRDPASGRWRVVHKLNHCGRADAAIYRHGLGEFFVDDLWRQEAALMPLSPELERQLLAVLADDARTIRLNERAYSMVAYAWATTYQQSNQWAIETIAAASDHAVTDRARAQAWLRLHDYRAGTLHVDALSRLGARLTQANVAFDDHPVARRAAGRIDTVTADSVFDWLQRSGLGRPLEVVR